MRINTLLCSVDEVRASCPEVFLSRSRASASFRNGSYLPYLVYTVYTTSGKLLILAAESKVLMSRATEPCLSHTTF